ncbi:MAG: carbon starvation protein A [Syntrophomonas sp.]
MHALTLIVIAALVYVLAYRFYAAFIAAKVLTLDTMKSTPAQLYNDGHDFSPTNRWVVFGHHFAAIAGAGPLIGPVLAAQFGYLPGYLWILVGAVTAGAVHDMVILFASVRHEGQSLAEIARQELGGFSGKLVSVAILFFIIIILTAVGVTVVNALYQSPWGVFTVGFTFPVAILVGVYLKWLRPGHIGEATFIGVVLVLLGVVLGPYVQSSSLAQYLSLSKNQLSIIIPIYGFLAAVLPVWLLLIPRDYLSSYMKIGTILLLAVGVILINPVLQMPACTSFVGGGGPIVPGKVWPFMFITIACGALSGWHSLVSSGTTPKLVSNEADVKMIGYGAMLTEGFVAIMALIAASVLSPGDYFAINSTPEVFAKLGMNIQDLSILSQAIGEELAGRTGGAVSLAVGMTHIFSGFGAMENLMSYWYHFAIMFEALFILTLIDAGTRIGRYLLQELGGAIYKPLKDPGWWPGILITSAAFTYAWGYLLYGGTIATIWPLSGVANQLVAAIALAIGTTMIIRMGRAKYSWVTLIPLAFISVTTITAGYQNIVLNYLPQQNYLLAGITGLLLIMVIAIIIQSLRKWVTLLGDNANIVDKGIRQHSI